ncbi:MAG: glycosyltransferase family 1 protein [Bacillota bacterium]|nr:glycosyltransferase family 1 protein [Bacillota bacterium]
MHIVVDARAAFAYRGTGIGTYTAQLLQQLLRLDRANRYTLLLPGDQWVEAAPGMGDLLAWCGQKQADFWEEVAPVTSPLPPGADVYFVPHNGLGLPKPQLRAAEPAPPRLVVTVHDLIPYVLPQTCSRTFLRRALAEIPRAVAEADAVITVSLHSKRDLQTLLGVPENRLVVIPEAPEERFTPLDRDVCRARVARRYALDRPFILNVGGFSRRKNLPRLVEAFAEVCRTTALPHQLVLVGRPGGGSYAQCQALAERLGIADRVVFPGFVAGEDLPFLYNAADLFVFPSLYEGFGLPPLEAMACGVPVIAANTSSLPEVTGEAARLVDPLDPGALARSIREVLTNPAEAEQLSEAGRKRAEGFSWRRTAWLTLLALERAATGPS